MEYIKIKKDDYIEVADAIDIIEVLLKERSDMADTYYSNGISNVNLLGQVLFSLTDENYKQREIGLYGIRLMHNMENFEREMKFGMGILWYFSDCSHGTLNLLTMKIVE